MRSTALLPSATALLILLTAGCARLQPNWWRATSLPRLGEAMTIIEREHATPVNSSALMRTVLTELLGPAARWSSASVTASCGDRTVTIAVTDAEPRIWIERLDDVRGDLARCLPAGQPHDDAGFDRALLERMARSLPLRAEVAPYQPLDPNEGAIGVEVAKRDGQVVVVEAFDGMPAALAGIHAGDVLLAVDDVALTDDLPQAILAMRGPVGRPATVRLLRRGEAEPVTLRMDRALIRLPPPTIGWPRPGLAHLRLRRMPMKPEEVHAALVAARDAGATGLALDLRGNSGGILQAALGVAAMLLPPSTPLVGLRERRPTPVAAPWAVTESAAMPGIQLTSSREGADVLAGRPVVVLVDGGTASGAEIIALALREQRAARLVGTPTFGMGTIETLYVLGRDTVFRLTTATVYGPNGTPLDKHPLQPDGVAASPPLGSPAGTPDAPLATALDLLAAQAHAGQP